MEIDKVHRSLTNLSNDVTTITKLTSNISYSYTEDFYPNLNLSFSQTAEAKLRTYDYPMLKRSQSHKRHHFKVDIGTIVNEELNEEDSENITAINYSQCSFSSSNHDIDDIEILKKISRSPPHLNCKQKEDYLSPKTQLLLSNLKAELNNSFNRLNEDVPEEEWDKPVSSNYHSICKVLVLYNDNEKISRNTREKEVIMFNDQNLDEREENNTKNYLNKKYDCCNNENDNNDESFSHILINRHNLSSYSNMSNQDPNEYTTDQVCVIPTIFSRILKQEALRSININQDDYDGEPNDEEHYNLDYYNGDNNSNV